MSSQLLEKYLDLRLMQKILGWFTALVLCLIPMDFFVLSAAGRPGGTLPIQKPFLLKSKISAEPLDVYLEAFQRSSLFGSPAAEKQETDAVSSMAELLKDYRLKGVIISDVPEAIFEDARTQQSSFVHKGEKLGALEVRDIREGAVVLGYMEEELTVEIK